jgi:hypothetical protein
VPGRTMSCRMVVCTQQRSHVHARAAVLGAPTTEGETERRGYSKWEAHVMSAYTYIGYVISRRALVRKGRRGSGVSRCACASARARAETVRRCQGEGEVVESEDFPRDSVVAREDEMGQKSRTTRGRRRWAKSRAQHEGGGDGPKVAHNARFSSRGGGGGQA